MWTWANLLRDRIGLTLARAYNQFENKLPPPPVPSSYRVFTREFDEVVSVADLVREPVDLSPADDEKYLRARIEFDLYSSLVVPVALNTGSILVGEIRRHIPREQRRHVVVSFLIDHSGSMHGLGMTGAILATSIATDLLRRTGVATEVLGFTTAGWHGGRSQKKWQLLGRPRDPGRLCALRHIVYSEAGGPPASPDQLGYALRPGVLFENVDGEAIEWAVSRLESGQWTRRIVIVLSDGAPVDDSTLVYNRDRAILRDHMRLVVEQVRRDGRVELASLVLDVHPTPIAVTEVARGPVEAAFGMIALLHHLFTGEPSATAVVNRDVMIESLNRRIAEVDVDEIVKRMSVHPER